MVRIMRVHSKVAHLDVAPLGECALVDLEGWARMREKEVRALCTRTIRKTCARQAEEGDAPIRGVRDFSFTRMEA